MLHRYLAGSFDTVDRQVGGRVKVGKLSGSVIGGLWIWAVDRQADRLDIIEVVWLKTS